jgi:hypothetical protein
MTRMSDSRTLCEPAGDRMSPAALARIRSAASRTSPLLTGTRRLVAGQPTAAIASMQNSSPSGRTVHGTADRAGGGSDT